MDKAKAFRKPQEMVEDEVTVPMYARVKPSTKAVLEKAAKDIKGLTFSKLVSTILDDYVEWLKKQ